MKLRFFILFLLVLALLCSCSVRIVQDGEPSAEPAPASSAAGKSGRTESGLFDTEAWSFFSSVLSPKEPVGDEWFSGCCLLGDSLTDGMRLFSGLDTPDYLCSGGADTSNIL